MDSRIFNVIQWQKDRTQFDLLIDTEDINGTDELNYNFLQTAIASNKTDIALELIRRGIDLNHKDYKGLSALHYTAQFNNVIVANVIIENGGDVNIMDDRGNNPLWTAVFNSNGKYYDIVKLLIDNDGNPFSKNNYGKSPLDFAKQIKDVRLIDMLLKNPSS